MIAFGFGRHPGRMLVVLAVIFALAHFVLAPAGVPIVAQLVLTYLASRVLLVLWQLLARERRIDLSRLSEQSSNDRSNRPGF